MPSAAELSFPAPRPIPWAPSHKSPVREGEPEAQGERACLPPSPSLRMHVKCLPGPHPAGLSGPERRSLATIKGLWGGARVGAWLGVSHSEAGPGVEFYSFLPYLKSLKWKIPKVHKTFKRQINITGSLVGIIQLQQFGQSCFY